MIMAFVSYSTVVANEKAHNKNEHTIKKSPILGLNILFCSPKKYYCVLFKINRFL
jgi:hypothetical protein